MIRSGMLFLLTSCTRWVLVFAPKMDSMRGIIKIVMSPFANIAKVAANEKCCINPILLKRLLAKPRVVVKIVSIMGRPICLAMYLTASLRELPCFFSLRPRKKAAIICVSSVDPITIIREGIIALKIFRGTPNQPIIPKVQIIVSSDVTNGTKADNQLRMKIKIDRIRITTDKGPSKIKSS